MVNFADLRVSKLLLKALEEMDYVYPTLIQKKTFRNITAGKDVVGISPTGTGKTFAYLLPVLGSIDFSKEVHPRVIIVLPTRELVIQVKEEAQKLCRYKNLRIKEVYGGVNIRTQIELLREGGVDVLIGTPGRLFDIAVTGIIRFTGVKKFIIDEVDELLNLGFRPQVEQIMTILPSKRQNIMFSSTLSINVENFIKSYFLNPQIITIPDENPPIERIKHLFYKVPNFYTKLELITEFIKNSEYSKVLIFTENKKHADIAFEEISEKLLDASEVVGIIHSNKSQNNRFNTIKKFEKGKIKALISTDIVARGIDFKNVSHVINLNIPKEYKDFLNRIGRTGRAGMEGTEILLISDFEKIPEYLSDISLTEEILPEGITFSKKLMEEEKIFYQNKIILKQPELKPKLNDKKKPNVKKSKKKR